MTGLECWDVENPVFSSDGILNQLVLQVARLRLSMRLS
jgi:hypothetical protein